MAETELRQLDAAKGKIFTYSNKRTVLEILRKISESTDEYVVLNKEEVYYVRPAIDFLREAMAGDSLNKDFQGIIDRLNEVVNEIAIICKAPAMHDRLLKALEERNAGKNEEAS